MGKKVHPNIARLHPSLGQPTRYRAKWIARPRDYAKKVQIDLLTRAYLEKGLQSAGVSAIYIAFTTKESHLGQEGLRQGLANITVHVARPGVVIGKKGGAVERMKKELELIVGMPVYLSIQEVRKPELDAKLVAENIANQIVRRINHRRAMKKAQENAMKMGALGFKAFVAGRLGGTEIARREGTQAGSVPLHTFSKYIDYAQATAQTSSGKVGVVVYVHTKPNAHKDTVKPMNLLEGGARRPRNDRERPSRERSYKGERGKRHTPKDRSHSN